ncbi:hypothetical protein GCM10023238_28540 [Streptomyces heliomycini]
MRAAHRLDAGEGSFRQRITARAVLDPETAAAGEPLEKGLWTCTCASSPAAGARRPGSARCAARTWKPDGWAALTGGPRRLVLPYWTDGPGNLSLDVDQHTNKLEREAVARMDPAGGRGRGLGPYGCRCRCTSRRTPVTRCGSASSAKNVGKYPPTPWSTAVP